MTTNYSTGAANVQSNAYIAALAGGVGGPAAPASFAFTPETLLFYCSSRLESIDTQIDKYFKDQQALNKATKEFGDLESIMSRDPDQWNKDDQRYIDHKDGIDAYQAGECNEILTIYRKTDNPDVKKACEDAFRVRSGHDISEYGKDGVVTADDIAKGYESKAIDTQTKEQWAARIDSMKTTAGGLSKNAELNMIQLQSLVSQRQLAIQLTTQLMQTAHESSKQVVGNIR